MLPTLEFYSDTWSRFSPDTEALDFRLSAKPPVAASVVLVVYSSSSTASSLVRVGEYELDNIPSTAPTSRILVPIKASKRYTFSFHGKAHNLFPSDPKVSVGFQLWANGERIDDFGNKKSVDNRAAEIIGILNARRA